MDKVGAPRSPAARSASPTFNRSTEERLAEALRQVASLKLELARVRDAYAVLLAARQAEAVASPPEHIKPSAEPARHRRDDFDWETWARIKKARIRGEDVEATAA